MDLMLDRVKNLCIMRASLEFRGSRNAKRKAFKAMFFKNLDD